MTLKRLMREYKEMADVHRRRTQKLNGLACFQMQSRTVRETSRCGACDWVLEKCAVCKSYALRRILWRIKKEMRAKIAAAFWLKSLFLKALRTWRQHVANAVSERKLWQQFRCLGMER